MSQKPNCPACLFAAASKDMITDETHVPVDYAWCMGAAYALRMDAAPGVASHAWPFSLCSLHAGTVHDEMLDTDSMAAKRVAS